LRAFNRNRSLSCPSSILNPYWVIFITFRRVLALMALVFWLLKVGKRKYWVYWFVFVQTGLGLLIVPNLHKVDLGVVFRVTCS
jgi:hypothetical protein